MKVVENKTFAKAAGMYLIATAMIIFHDKVYSSDFVLSPDLSVLYLSSIVYAFVIGWLMYKGILTVLESTELGSMARGAMFILGVFVVLVYVVYVIWPFLFLLTFRA